METGVNLPETSIATAFQRNGSRIGALQATEKIQAWATIPLHCTALTRSLRQE
jgi:hypothetical protein